MAGTGERERRAVVLAGVAVVAVLALVAGAIWWSGRDRRPDVLVIGDSVSYLSATALEARLGASHVQFATKPGYTTEQILPVAREAASIDGEPGAARDVAVVLIGYNDIFLDVTDESPLDELVAFAQEFRCTVWLTLPERPGGERSASTGVPTTALERWNRQLADVVAGHPSIHLDEGWQRAIEQAPPTVVLEPDAIHPTDAGSRALADAVGTAVDRHC